jgi:hypothetical protein
MPKRWQRAHHHHHQLNTLLIQYARLTDEQKALAMESDIYAIASTLDANAASQILNKIIAKIRAGR